MALKIHVCCKCTFRQTVRQITPFLSSHPSPQRQVHNVKPEKKLNVPPWMRRLAEKRKEAAETTEREPEVVNDTPVIMKYLQDAKKLGSMEKQLNETRKVSLKKEDFESSLKDIKFDIEALKHAQKESNADVDTVKLESESGQTELPRDMLFGSPDPTVPASDVPCGGCGANLHCQDTGLPGFIPKETFKGLMKEDLQKQLCQRCTMLTNHNHLIHYGIDKQTYAQVVQKIRSEKALVVMVIDVMDMENSVIKEFLKRIGERRPVYIVGNKIDLLPRDQKGYMNNVAKALIETCLKANLNPKENNIRHVCLVSAKTGYGIEELITKLMNDWEYKGNVYLVGTTNSGKSTLFNIFLRSDYCKSSVRDIVQRATVSQWPGTTLNLLKFPIINPAGWRLSRRVERLKGTRVANAEERAERLQMYRKYGGLSRTIVRELVEKTDFRSQEEVDEEVRQKMSSGSLFPTYSIGSGDNIQVKCRTRQEMTQAMQIVTDEHFPNSKWLFDTPGLINDDQVITRLTVDELRAVLPERILQPRVFLLKHSQVMFITGLARIDCLEGPDHMNVCVFTNPDLPVHIVDATEADEFYRTNVGTKVLGVPIGDQDRLNKLPSLCGQEFTVTNQVNFSQATADIQLSSLGWISLLIRLRQCVHLRVYTPGGYGIHLRQPAMLANVVAFRGHKMRWRPEYSMKKLAI